MKCPVCQAKLLPVDGEMFCLQCGEAVQDGNLREVTPFDLEDTADPLLRRAISDATDGEVVFRVPAAATTLGAPTARAPDSTPEAVVASAEPAPKRSFVSLHVILAPPKMAGAGGVMAMPPAGPLAPP